MADNSTDAFEMSSCTVNIKRIFTTRGNLKKNSVYEICIIKRINQS